MEKKYWIKFRNGGYSDGFTLQGLKNQLKVPDSDHYLGGVADFGEMSEFDQEHSGELEWMFTAEEMAAFANESRKDILLEDRKIADAIIRHVVYPYIVEAASRGEKYVDIPHHALNYYTGYLLVKVLEKMGFDAQCNGNGHFVIEWGEEGGDWRDC